MKGRDLPSYVLRRKRDGVLLFRRRVAGRIVEVRMETQFPEGDPIPFALHQERERLLKQPEPVAFGRDIGAVIRHYRKSPKFTSLKPRTRSDYDKHLTFFATKIGHLEPRHIERHHVIAWRDQWAQKKSPHSANYRTRVLSIVMEYAKDMGLLTKREENPVKGIKSLDYEKQDRQPWPQDKVDAFRAAASGRTLLVFELLLGSGQRIGDVLKMKWSDIEDGGLNVKQNKTGKPLWVPLTAPLRAALDATRKRSVFILTNQKASGPWSYRGAAQAIHKIRDQIGALDYDNHALRYTAAVELLNAGADDDVIAAVTGQSTAMVRHYTRSARQKVRALKAREIRE